MSRVTFRTGKDHQESAAIWARQRLSDRGGRTFSAPKDQDGVLFADSVGLGKTWEALATAALVLYKAGPQRARRHVLILCPANLVTKWEDELSAGSPFRERLDAWARRLEKTGQAAPAKRVLATLSHVLPIRSAKHVKTRKKYGRFRPPGGTYIVSQSLLGGKGRGLSALRREQWDVVIVDEAHNSAARNALAKLQERKRSHTKLLLTATPFQLEPRQWNSLARNLLRQGHNVLNRPEITRYIEQLARVFDDPTQLGPDRALVGAASALLRKLASRTVPRTNIRRYEMLRLDGTTRPLAARLDELDDQTVRGVLADLAMSDAALAGFETSYFESRLSLALNEQRTYVATRLRRVLSGGLHGIESPRLRALRLWAEEAVAADLRTAVETGKPRKTIVFTAWVGNGATGEAEMLRRTLDQAFAAALMRVRREHRREWDRWLERGREKLRKLADRSSNALVSSSLRALATDEVTAVLAGKRRRFAGDLKVGIDKHAVALDEARGELRDLPDRDSFEGRALRRRIRDMERALSPWTNGRMLGAVARYTGGERRSERDRAATAFRQVGPPWVLVASNVGSEGIDLHTYTARIVHYDLEWNPARMEQREGRGDRVGRKLKDKLKILYCLVPRTYDERMFHQLVARDRWHGVLLGKPACRLENELEQAPLLDPKRLKRMRLDLSPSRRR